MNEPQLGAGIDPGMAFNPFLSSILDKTRRDLNPQPLDHESSPLTTRLVFRPQMSSSSFVPTECFTDSGKLNLTMMDRF
jgi:hypothetical protein